MADPINVLKTQQHLRDLADARQLLRHCKTVFNAIPNTRLSGIKGIKNTYDLCSAIGNFLVIEDSGKLHVWLSNKAAKFYTYETIVDAAYKKFDHAAINRLIIDYGHGFKSLREIYIDLLGRNE